METAPLTMLPPFVLLFKSYYVVWKLQPHSPVSTRHILFKSYYVVWKLFQYPLQKTDEIGLNRTM